MKKRLLSLALGMVMLLSNLVLFTACSSEETKDYGTIKPMTIVIAMMTDEKTTEAGIEATEKALNRITEGNLNTHIELKLYTEEEYYAKLEEQLLARRAAVAEGDTASSLGAVEDVVFDAEKNREVTAYPATYDNQIDIFFVGSKTKLESYRLWMAADATAEDYAEDPVGNSDPLISVLDEYMADSAPLISKYLAQGLLNAGKVYLGNVGEQCAIPSNAIYDDGEYMIIDKKLFDSYSYNLEEVTGVTSLQSFLVDVATDHPDVTPLYNLGCMGFESLTGERSVIAQYVNETVAPGDSSLIVRTMLDSAVFRGILNSVNVYAPINGKYPIAGNDLSKAEPGKFAVGYIQTDAEGIAAYEEDYYVMESRKSMVTTEQACSNMFAVSAFTSDAARCVEILNLMQTNEEFHNILTYGEENVTYTVDESTGMVKRNTEGDAIYVMDIHKTGNLFLTYQNTEMTEKELLYSADDWARAKATSRRVFYGPFLGFEIDYYDEEADADLWKLKREEVEILAQAYDQMMIDIFRYEELKDTFVDSEGNPIEITTYTKFLDQLAQQIKDANDGLVGIQIAQTSGKKSIYRQYQDWVKIHYSESA